ncbi:unnamed protein product [Schistosoma curassoni]|uniref:Dynein axonemal heavy chain 3 n=1 Tax=Schistosoma curassoni TaxID=6186 RepID=A0A183K440_9TREM|nr:unnamed protein product [Schistosoma curassoni]
MLNIPAVERKSAGNLVAQSTPKNVRPVIKEPRSQKRAPTSKQQGAKPERTGKPRTTITVRDDSFIVMNLKDNTDLPLSLQEKKERMLWGELNKKLEILRLEPLTVTRLTRGKESKHQNHPRLLRATLKNETDFLKSDGNVRILPDVPYSERNLVRNIPKESREQFFRGRNIIVQGVPENTDPTQANSDIREWKFDKQSLRLKTILTQHVTRLAKKDVQFIMNVNNSKQDQLCSDTPSESSLNNPISDVINTENTCSAYLKSPSPTLFPVHAFNTLNSLLSRPHWQVPVLPDSQLETVLLASINMAKHGFVIIFVCEDIHSQDCLRFYSDGLISSFQKIFHNDAVTRWDSHILHFIYANSLLGIELCSIKAKSDCPAILELESILFDPNSQ